MLSWFGVVDLKEPSSGPFSRHQLSNWFQQAVILHLSMLGTGLRARAAEVNKSCRSIQNFRSDSSDVKEKPGKER